MTDHTKNNGSQKKTDGGNAVVAVLVVLVVAAIGALAYMSGKMEMLEKDKAKKDMSTASSEAAPQDSNPVLAVLYGEEVRRQDVLNLVNSMPPQMRQLPPEQLFTLALEQIINNKIVDETAKGSGLEKDEEVQERLQQVEAQLVRTKFLENTVQSKMTEERVKEGYDNYVKNFPDIEEVKVAHILVDEEKLAKDIVKKLNNGGDFAELAKENSKDGSAENGGDLGYFAKGEVVPEFAEAAFSTEPGTYTKAPVKSDFGYHIIRVDEKRKRQPAPFEEARPFIEQEIQRAILDETMRELRDSVKIKRFDINGNPLPENPQNQEPAAGEVVPVPQPAEAAPTDAVTE